MKTLICAALAVAVNAFPQAGGSPAALTLPQVLMLNTHNSYSQEDIGGPEFPFRIGEQLDLGVRILEFDIWEPTGNEGEDGTITHNPASTVERHCSSVGSCMDQVKNWQANNPGHSPIILMFEVRNRAAGSFLPGREDTTTKFRRFSMNAVANQAVANDLKVVTYEDSMKPMSELTDSVILSVFRKNNDNGKLIDSIGQDPNYLRERNIFLAGRQPEDSDPDFAASDFGPDVLRINKQDNAPGPQAANVFTISSICDDEDSCRGAISSGRINRIDGANGLGVDDLFMVQPGSETDEAVIAEVEANPGLQLMQQIKENNGFIAKP